MCIVYIPTGVSRLVHTTRDTSRELFQCLALSVTLRQPNLRRNTLNPNAPLHPLADVTCGVQPLTGQSLR